MENGTFLVTVPVVYASVMWFLPLPDAFYSLSVFSRTSSQPTTDATVQSRLREYKQNHLPDWIPVFIKNGEIYFLVWSMLRLGCSDWSDFVKSYPRVADLRVSQPVIDLVKTVP